MVEKMNDCWVDGLTIGEVLRQTAKRFGDQDALVFPQLDVRMSYAQFDAVVDQAAKALVALGFKKGEHIGCWATNIAGVADSAVGDGTDWRGVCDD